jgi:N-acetylglucosaminyldiphosphoundecaprenol N-acetyl-beta-D-mannosaminyltransferase
VQHSFQRVNILGVEITAGSLDLAVRQMASWIDNRTRHYVNVCTVHTIMECCRNPVLRTSINNSGMATSDGMPLVWLCRYHGHAEATRVYGPDLMLALCEHSVSKGYRHFFYGGADGVAQELAVELEKRYPGLQVAGTYSPLFRAVGEMEDPEIIEKINAANPDIVWVGLGTPKQDFWVARHRPVLDAPVLVAVGAAFDFFTGRVPQAPMWMQRSGLEWLFRLIKEPRRLAFRYLVYNPLFLMSIFLQLTGLRRY